MSDPRWVVLGRFPNAIAAETCVAFLRDREIDARVEHGDPLSTALGS